MIHSASRFRFSPYWRGNKRTDNTGCIGEHYQLTVTMGQLCRSKLKQEQDRICRFVNDPLGPLYSQNKCDFSIDFEKLCDGRIDHMHKNSRSKHILVWSLELLPQNFPCLKCAFDQSGQFSSDNSANRHKAAGFQFSEIRHLLKMVLLLGFLRTYSHLTKTGVINDPLSHTRQSDYHWFSFDFE